MMARLLIFSAAFYRVLVSPVIHSLVPVRSGCRSIPTCSDYFIEAVRAEGALAGTRRGLLRLVRCHPFSKP